ncbi:12191_t:CDS:2, partial [Cetraspora pellucida]
LGLQFDEQSDLTNQFDSVEQLEQSNSNESYNSFVEDFVDAPAILIKELIPSTNGAPRKKQFKSSSELGNKSRSNIKQHPEAQKTRKPTQCQQCKNIGHNKASCEAWHKDRVFLTHIENMFIIGILSNVKS